MDFDKVIEIAKSLEGEVFLTSRRECSFTFHINEQSIEFQPVGGVSKSLSFEKFRRYVDIFFKDGRREPEFFLNNTGNSINGRATYFIPLLIYIEDRNKIK
ncbi:hypothetical protein [Rheinheimera sp.]|uniref:hypothetical protein n=1 Tax=Rheinheimera sp. TaxID=1869214 RepID=UPI003D295019